MDKRDFIKKFGLGLAGMAFSSAFNMCKPVDDDLDENARRDVLRNKLSSFLMPNEIYSFEDYPEILTQTRKIFIIKDFLFIDNRPELEKRGLDFLIQLEAVAVLLCNFDLYKYRETEYKINKLDENIFNIKMNAKENNMFLYRMPNLASNNIKIPIRINKNAKELVLESNYMLPCTLCINTFEQIISNKIKNI